MRKYMLKKFFLLSLFLMYSADASELNYKIEIKHLLEYVQNTSCKYIRNGDVHDGLTAAKHIHKKYDYYNDKIHTTEDFIRLSATKSMMFGSKYYIKCAGSAKEESAQWLLEELERFRKQEKS